MFVIPSSALRIVDLNGIPQGEFGAHENGNTQNHSFTAQSVHGSPAFRAQDVIDPALEQPHNGNPVSFQISPLNDQDREVIQRVSFILGPLLDCS